MDSRLASISSLQRIIINESIQYGSVGVLNRYLRPHALQSALLQRRSLHVSACSASHLPRDCLLHPFWDFKPDADILQVDPANRTMVHFGISHHPSLLRIEGSQLHCFGALQIAPACSLPRTSLLHVQRVSDQPRKGDFLLQPANRQGRSPSERLMAMVGEEISGMIFRVLMNVRIKVI